MNWRTVIDCFPIPVFISFYFSSLLFISGMWTLSCNDSPFRDHFLFQSRGWSFFFDHEMYDADHPEVSISLPRPPRVFLCHRFSGHDQLVRIGRDKTTPLSRQANMAHARQSRPDSGLGLQVKVLQTVEVVPSSLGGACLTAGKRTWHIQDSHGLIPALACRLMSFILLKFFPLRSGGH